MKLNKNAVEMLRAEQCLMVKEVAERAGISPNTISLGIRKGIDPATVGKIAKALNVNPRAIIEQ